MDDYHENSWIFTYTLWGKKKNIYIGIIVHILCNTVNVITGIAFIVKMT